MFGCFENNPRGTGIVGVGVGVIGVGDGAEVRLEWGYVGVGKLEWIPLGKDGERVGVRRGYDMIPEENEIRLFLSPLIGRHLVNLPLDLVDSSGVRLGQSGMHYGC